MRKPYPLQWPEGWPRTPAESRVESPFYKARANGAPNAITGRVSTQRHALPFNETHADLRNELRRLGAANYVITTDLPLKSDGTPYASSKIGDVGIAVWFLLPDTKGNVSERVLACDKWRTHADNMYSIAKTIEAMRGIERWGASDLVQRAFAGFTALPPGPGGEGDPAPRPKRTWRAVLGVDSAAYLTLDIDDVVAIAEAKYRTMIRAAHPDVEGGSHDATVELNTARDEMMLELGAHVQGVGGAL